MLHSRPSLKSETAAPQPVPTAPRPSPEMAFPLLDSGADCDYVRPDGRFVTAVVIQDSALRKKILSTLVPISSARY